MVEVDEFNTSSALEWINNLNAQGTTNTLGKVTKISLLILK
jgi:hypothetical protein